MFAAHRPWADIAEACGVSLSAVGQWKRAWRASGEAGLAARLHPGPEPLLTPDDLWRLDHMLRAGAHRAGFDSDLWTCRRVTQLIQQRFGVTYHLSHVWKVLRKLGWSCQKPERRARERDEAAIEHWRKVRWPQIKKGATA